MHEVFGGPEWCTEDDDASPVSSRISRTAVCGSDSPGSTLPLGSETSLCTGRWTTSTRALAVDHPPHDGTGCEHRGRAPLAPASSPDHSGAPPGGDLPHKHILHVIEGLARLRTAVAGPFSVGLQPPGGDVIRHGEVHHVVELVDLIAVGDPYERLRPCDRGCGASCRRCRCTPAGRRRCGTRRCERAPGSDRARNARGSFRSARARLAAPSRCREPRGRSGRLLGSRGTDRR